MNEAVCEIHSSSLRRLPFLSKSFASGRGHVDCARRAPVAAAGGHCDPSLDPEARHRARDGEAAPEGRHREVLRRGQRLRQPQCRGPYAVPQALGSFPRALS